MDLLTLHGRLATAIVIYLAVTGLWGLFLGLRGLGPTPGYRGALVIVELLAVAQGAFGVGVALTRGLQSSVHILYGLALVAALPLAATLMRDRQPRGQSIALGLAVLFAMGLALRGCTTAS